jgi:hypothetical protein
MAFTLCLVLSFNRCVSEKGQSASTGVDHLFFHGLLRKPTAVPQLTGIRRRRVFRKLACVRRPFSFVAPSSIPTVSPAVCTGAAIAGGAGAGALIGEGVGGFIGGVLGGGGGTLVAPGFGTVGGG